MAGTKVVAQAIGTGIEGFLKNFAPQLTDAGRNSIKVIRNRTDLNTLSKLNPEQSRQVIEHANNGQLVHMMKDVEDAGRGLLDQSREAKAIDAVTRDPNAPIEPEVDPQRLAGRQWFQQGGGQDVELNKLLTKGRGKNAPQQTLEELIEEAKTSKGAQTKLDRYKSMLATGPAADESDKIVYGIKGNNPDQITRQFEGEAGYNPSFHQGTEFHHKSMKELEGEIGLKAKQLQQSGAASEDDLYDLFELGRSRELESGSRKGAGIYAQRASHQALHQNIMLPSGIQPSMTKWTNKPLRSRPSEVSKKIWDAAKAIDPEVTRYDLEYIKAWSGNRSLEEAIAKWQAFKKSEAYKYLGPDGESEISRMVNQIKAIDNIEDLKKYKTMILDQIAEPMTKEAELLERVVSQNMTARELFEVADPQQIADLAQKVKGDEARLAEDLSDKQMRKAIDAAYE